MCIRDRISLSPETGLIHESPAPFVWSVVSNGSDGFWTATGDEGRVYEIGADGDSSIFFDAVESEVHALARRPEGGLYVGTGPNGKVYEVQANGESTTLVNLEETYIWSMVIGPDDALYVATGTQGVIYRIESDGTTAPFYNTLTTNVLSLAFDSQGRLLAGTESPGLCFESTAITEVLSSSTQSLASSVPCELPKMEPFIWLAFVANRTLPNQH